MLKQIFFLSFLLPLQYLNAPDRFSRKRDRDDLVFRPLPLNQSIIASRMRRTGNGANFVAAPVILLPSMPTNNKENL